MKLLSKLTLYATISKTAIVLLFIALLPGMVSGVASRYTNYYLLEQKKKVLQNIGRNGIDYYFDGDSTYGSYTMLKDEYISLEPAPSGAPADSILTARRIIETDTLNYRLLNHVFEYHNKKYLLEIGKTVAAINQYNRPLQRVALYSLAGLIAITLIFDLLFTRLLLRPLGLIIRSKLQHRKFPFKEIPAAVDTSTSDFKYLDRSLISLMTKIRGAFEKEREFTSNASHELMTPVSILQNKMENLLMDGDITEASQEKISGMLVTLQRLKKIVRSLLLISRIENDQFAKVEEVLPQALLKEVVDELQDKLEARGITVVETIASTTPLPGINHDLLFQLFYNLVNNAIRYNKDEGSIHISDKCGGEKGYAIVITDTGVGIHANELAGIFDRFKKSSKTTEEGYGLGLSIVKSIALYHQINIEVSSVPGEGSTFCVWFPHVIIRDAH